MPMKPDVTRKSAFITGATGFIGFHVAQAFAADGWQIHAWVRNRNLAERVVSLERFANIRNTPDPAADIADLRPEAVLHIAAAGPQAFEKELIKTNIEMTSQIAEAIADYPETVFVNTGSWWEWNAQGRPVPTNIYAASKTAGRLFAEIHARRAGYPMATLIMHDVYGPNDWRGKLLSTLLSAAEQNPVALSPGKQKLDLVHIDDVCAAYAMTVEALRGTNVEPPRVFSVATGQRADLHQIVEKIEKAQGRPVAVEFDARPYAPDTVMEPACPAPPPPGWTAKVGFEDWLRKQENTPTQAP